MAEQKAARAVGGLRKTLRDYHLEFSGYDPTFTWWTSEPFKKSPDKRGSTVYALFLRERVVRVEARRQDDDRW